MRRGTIFVILFVVAAVVVIGASQFLRSQPPLELQVAVDPLAAPWLESALNRLNASEPIVNATRRVQFRAVTIDDLDVWNRQRPWTQDNHPIAWIAASSVSLDYAVADGLPFQTEVEMLARSPLVWGGYSSRVELITGSPDAPLDWQAVQAAAEDESWEALGGDRSWGFINIGLLQADRKIGGLATLFSGAATFAGDPILTGDNTRATDFRNWMQPILQSRSSASGDPAFVMASSGVSQIQLGIFPEVQWLTNLNGMASGSEGVRLSYPEYQFILDFPLARWQDAATTEDERQAVTLLARALSGAAEQARLPEFGLRPAAGEPEQDAALFAAGVPFGILLTPDYGQTVTAPSRGDAQGLIQWAVTNS